MARFLDNIPPVTRNLLYVNVIMFVATLINRSFMQGTFAMAFPLATDFRWWQPLTHMFMHDGFFHIFFNRSSSSFTPSPDLAPWPFTQG